MIFFDCLALCFVGDSNLVCVSSFLLVSCAKVYLSFLLLADSIPAN
jgi:hypothetical protein